jgi:amidase
MEISVAENSFWVFFTLIGVCYLAGNLPAKSAGADFTGRWEVTTTYPGGVFVAGLDLTAQADKYEGKSGYLVPDYIFPYKYRGSGDKDELDVEILAPDRQTAIGNLHLRVSNGKLFGKGLVHSLPVTVNGIRPRERPSVPSVHTFTPSVYYRTFSGGTQPVLKIFPGDTVRTKTVDSSGFGQDGVAHALPGNPQTGPFYIEGAMIGDTIAIHFNSIRPNRDTAFQQRAALSPRVLPPGYQQHPEAKWSNSWTLNRSSSLAVPDDPSEKLKNFKVSLAPMLGCVSVAPFWDQSFVTPDLGPYGGNIDYNQIQEGTTLYMPVYQAGALLTIGDGHALQADGEITGQGLETSMDVDFTVNLIRDQLLDQPWAETGDYIMVSGIGNSLEDALRLATAGISNWLKSFYALNSSEIATVLAAAVHYDIAEVVDPRVHIVAKIQKSVLSQLPKPAAPAFIFCQAGRGCMVNQTHGD